MRWFRISARKGDVKPVARVPKAAKDLFDAGEEVEELLYAALLLAPDAIGVAGELPLVAAGGQSVVDLEFVDAAGQLTLVECKKEPATVGDLVQLLGYGWSEAGSLTPVGEFSTCLGRTAAEMLGAMLARTTGSPKMRTAASACLGVDKPSALQKHVRTLDRAAGSGGWTTDRGDKLGRRLWGTDWPKLSAASESTVREVRGWPGQADPLLSGALQRMILVAPEFEDECLTLAEMLKRRGIWLDLVPVTVRREGSDSPADLYLGVDSARGRSCEGHALLKLAIHTVCNNEASVRRFASAQVAAENLGKATCFPSLQLCTKAVDSDPEFILELSLRAGPPGNGSVSVCLAHGAYDGDKSARSKASSRLREALGPIRGSREHRGNHTWEFAIPGQRDEWYGTFERVMDACYAATTKPESQ